ncbi:MAG: hypothetical protein DRP84_00655 [Spirochaetes bacterium]|nr:MAG: hypothetical protein DRP84_00655 [Spirochaetota bacterium]
MSGKVVLVAGASSGTGRATALYLAEKGYRVSICARRKNLIDEIVRKINSEGGIAYSETVDITSWNEVERFFDNTVKKFGRLDVVVNNVGAGIRYTKFENLTINEIDDGIRINLISVLYGCKAAIPVMKKQREGYIINVSSILGKRSRSGLAVYTAGKHAVEGFSRALWNEVKEYGIKVSIIAPAMINTEWAKKAGIEKPFTSGKMIEPEDIAHIIEFLITLPKYYNVWSVDLMALSQTIDPL